MIRNIKWDNHKVLGNLELDFTKADGTPYNTIVLAGENGTGKTQILETIGEFLDLGTFEPFDKIDYMVDSEIYVLSKINRENAKYGFHKRLKVNANEILAIHRGRNNDEEGIQADKKDIRSYGFAYSKARSGFKTEKVYSATTQQLDLNKYENDSKEDFTNIKQLLVDIDTQDNSEWMRITVNNVGINFDEFRKASKKFRFEKAFNSFF